jgi:uncharacterized membrane protein YfcA
VVLFAIYRFFKAPLIPEKEPITSPALLFILGLFTGVAAISVGIGGSLILTPVLSAFFRFELKKSVSVALFFIVFSSISGFISISLAGHINYQDGIIIGASSLAGVWLGINLAHKTDAKRHKNFILLLYLVTILLLIKRIIGV